MTRNVICTVYNLTNESFYVNNSQTSVWNGHQLLNPQTIPANGGEAMQLFSYEKTTGSVVGVTGKVSYQLGNDNSLQISFNNPYSQVVDGPDYNYSLCFFYAGITGVSEQNPSLYNVTCDAFTNGQPWDPTSTDEVKELTANIYINYNN
jgi:hypothetical protein